MPRRPRMRMHTSPRRALQACGCSTQHQGSRSVRHRTAAGTRRVPVHHRWLAPHVATRGGALHAGAYHPRRLEPIPEECGRSAASATPLRPNDHFCLFVCLFVCLPARARLSVCLFPLGRRLFGDTAAAVLCWRARSALALKPCRNGAESTRQSTRLSRTCMAMLYSSVMQRSRHRARRCNMPQRNDSVFAHAAKGGAYCGRARSWL